jgi:hypothetical protein
LTTFPATGAPPAPRAGVASAILALLVAMEAACTVRDGELGRQRGGPDADAGAPGCGLTSPTVQIGGRSLCAGRLAGATFTNTLCSCGNLELGESLQTHGFDARQGPFQAGAPDDGGASVGINGSYLPRAGTTLIAGSLAIAGAADLMLTGNLNVRGDFWAAGNVVSVGAAAVARNAWLGGNFLGVGPLTVKGTVHHAGSVVAVPLTAGADRMGPVTVPAPCPCGPDQLLDVAAIVDGGRLDNDNASLGLSPDAFAAVLGVSNWTLPCGRAYLSRIGGIASLTIHVTGRSVVFIDGSVDLTGALLFDVAPGAEVDVFVKNDVTVRGGLALANKDRPAAGRLWVGGSQPITLLSPWVGNLYAPRAQVVAHVGLESWGSIFAGGFSGDVLASFTFDRSIVDSGAACGADQPAAPCRQCGDCSGGTACVAGMCTACASDADCCSLSVCANGRCAPLLTLESR